MNTVTSVELVAAVPGLTYRQLDYWVRRGYIVPTVPATGSGRHKRRFDAAVVDRIANSIGVLRAMDDQPELYRRILSGEVVVSIEEVTS